jgi:hypothetical protein
MKKLLLGYRDNMRVEIESGVTVTAKTVADPSRTPHVAGRAKAAAIKTNHANALRI